MHQGSIAEKGTHEGLIAAKGLYARMWENHCKHEKECNKMAIQKKKVNKTGKALWQATGAARKVDDDEGSDGYNSMASSAFLQTGASTPRDLSDDSRNNSDSNSNASTSDGESSRSPSRQPSPEYR
jgi:ATP-binding cassette, subfamily B, vacuolar membrane transporter HMT1/ACLQ